MTLVRRASKGSVVPVPLAALGGSRAGPCPARAHGPRGGRRGRCWLQRPPRRRLARQSPDHKRVERLVRQGFAAPAHARPGDQRVAHRAAVPPAPSLAVLKRKPHPASRWRMPMGVQRELVLRLSVDADRERHHQQRVPARAKHLEHVSPGAVGPKQMSEDLISHDKVGRPGEPGLQWHLARVEIGPVEAVAGAETEIPHVSSPAGPRLRIRSRHGSRWPTRVSRRRL